MVVGGHPRGTIHPAADIVSRSPGLAVRETTLKDGVFSTP